MAVAVRLTGALIVLLSLTGCVHATTPLQSSFTDAERDAYARDRIEQIWAMSGTDREPPADLSVIFVSPGDWGTTVVNCLSEAGFSNYTPLDYGFSWEGSASTPEEDYARLVCMASWQVDPAESGVMGPEQLGYLYDFYRESTVPCLERLGMTVLEAPTRAQFIETGGNWYPFPEGDSLTAFEMGESPWYRSFPDNDIAATCAIWPPEWGPDPRFD